MSGELNFTLKLQADVFTGPADNAKTATADLKSEVGRASSGVDALTQRIRNSITAIEDFQSGTTSAGEAARKLRGGADSAAEGVEKISEKMSIAVAGVVAQAERLSKINFTLKLQADVFTGPADNAKTATADLKSEVGRASSGVDALTQRIRNSITAIEDFQSGTTSAGEAARKLRGGADSAAEGVEKISEKSTGITGLRSSFNFLSIAVAGVVAQAERLSKSDFLPAQTLTDIKSFTADVKLATRAFDTFTGSAIAGFAVAINYFTGGRLAAAAQKEAIIELGKELDKKSTKLADLQKETSRLAMTPKQQLSAVLDDLAENKKQQTETRGQISGSEEGRKAALKLKDLQIEAVKLQEQRLRIGKQVTEEDERQAKAAERKNDQEAKERDAKLDKLKDFEAQYKEKEALKNGDKEGARDAKLQREAEKKASDLGVPVADVLGKLKEMDGFQDQIDQAKKDLKQAQKLTALDMQEALNDALGHGHKTKARKLQRESDIQKKAEEFRDAGLDDDEARARATRFVDSADRAKGGRRTIKGYNGAQRDKNPFLDHRSFNEFFNKEHKMGAPRNSDAFNDFFHPERKIGALKNPGVEPVGKMTKKQAREDEAKKEAARATPRWDSVVHIEQILAGVVVA